MASSTKTVRTKHKTPQVETVYEESIEESKEDLLSQGSEQNSINLITFDDPSGDNISTSHSFAKRPPGRTHLATPITTDDYTISMPETPPSAIQRLKTQVSEREERIQKALQDLEKLGVGIRKSETKEPSQDLNVSNLTYDTPNADKNDDSEVPTRSNKDEQRKKKTQTNQTEDDDSSDEDQSFPSSSDDDPDSYDTSSSEETSDDDISLPPPPTDGTVSASTVDYWLALQESARKLKKARKKANKKKKKTKASADVIFRYLMKAANDYALPALDYSDIPARRRAKHTTFLDKLKMVTSSVRQTKDVLTKITKPKPPKTKQANQAQKLSHTHALNSTN